MAGDWIKMRGNLWDDPRVGRIADMTDTGEAAVIGGLYWLWAAADQHTEDGVMPGLSLRRIDSKTGIKGFGEALVSIGWLADHEDGVRIIKFEEHNGASAKKRCQTAKRVAAFKAGNADETPLPDEGNADGVTKPLPVRDLEKEIEEEKREEKTGESAPRKRSTPTPAIAKPDDVDQQTWADWLTLRKAKKAPVTETVVGGARDESAKAGMTLDAFLQVWCLRGSQGLQADWLKPEERKTASRVQPMSYAQQDQANKRATWEAMTGRKWPESDEFPEFIDVAATSKSETLLVAQQGL